MTAEGKLLGSIYRVAQ